MSATDPKRPDDATSTGDATSAAPAPDVDPDEPDTRAHTDTDSGRHAVSRPAPTPPDPDHRTGDASPDPVLAPAGRPARDDDAGASAPTTGPSTGTPSAAPAADPRDRAHAPAGPVAPHAPTHAPTDRSSQDGTKEELFPDPHAPRTPHAGTHVLGALVGLVLAPPAVAFLLLGQSRILRVQVEGWDASLELLGIVLVSAAALVLAVLLLLGLWSAAVPITAGLVLGALGGLQLYAPGVARAAALDVVGSESWALTVKQTTVAGTSGTTLTVGLLLLTSGVVTALARRHGVRLGTFRERNRPV